MAGKKKKPRSILPLLEFADIKLRTTPKYASPQISEKARAKGLL